MPSFCPPLFIRTWARSAKRNWKETKCLSKSYYTSWKEMYILPVPTGFIGFWNTFIRVRMSIFTFVPLTIGVFSVVPIFVARTSSRLKESFPGSHYSICHRLPPFPTLPTTAPTLHLNNYIFIKKTAIIVMIEQLVYFWGAVEVVPLL